MPISQSEMTDAQSQAVAETLMDRLERIGGPRYTRDGDDWGITPPIEPGELRTSRGGAPWAVFGNYAYRLMDTDTATCVLDGDGRPLGVADEGLLVITETPHGTVAVVVNTGYNMIDEVIWS